MKTLGIGLIGCGNISTTYLDLAPLFKGVEIRSVTDLDAELAAEKAETYGVRSEPLDAMLASDDIEMVVNLTIPEAHYAISKQALEAGKHVYSEKPFVLSLEEGLELTALAKAKGVRLGSSPDTFLGGSHQQARAVLDAGDVGDIVSGTCHIMGHGMEDWHPNPDFFYREGGGPILDMGPYYLTNLVQLLGPVARVQTVSDTPFKTRTIANGPRNGEDVPVTTPTTFHAILQFANGAIITLGASWDVWKHRHDHMELYGTKGSLFLPDPNFFGDVVKMAKPGGEIEDLAVTTHPFHVDNQGTQANYRTAGAADMAQAVLEGRPHRCNGDLALHVVEVMTSILKAGETGHALDMQTSCERPLPLGENDAAALLK
ncbi:Gfo/Idh/MocA family oxidoreductase [Octadecabacter sp.]|nr:Gfo/Idh/MocA family oxidoreductase [Octadecabacter sp.]